MRGAYSLVSGRRDSSLRLQSVYSPFSRPGIFRTRPSDHIGRPCSISIAQLGAEILASIYTVSTNIGTPTNVSACTTELSAPFPCAQLPNSLTRSSDRPAPKAADFRTLIVCLTFSYGVCHSSKQRKKPLHHDTRYGEDLLAQHADRILAGSRNFRYDTSMAHPASHESLPNRFCCKSVLNGWIVFAYGCAPCPQQSNWPTHLASRSTRLHLAALF